MKTNTIITIGREFGSAGREIGYKVAKEFGIKLYDKEINYLHSCGQKVFVTVSTVNEVIGQWNSK